MRTRNHCQIRLISHNLSMSVSQPFKNNPYPGTGKRNEEPRMQQKSLLFLLLFSVAGSATEIGRSGAMKMQGPLSAKYLKTATAEHSAQGTAPQRAWPLRPCPRFAPSPSLLLKTHLLSSQSLCPHLFPPPRGWLADHILSLCCFRLQTKITKGEREAKGKVHGLRSNGLWVILIVTYTL